MVNIKFFTAYLPNLILYDYCANIPLMLLLKNTFTCLRLYKYNFSYLHVKFSSVIGYNNIHRLTERSLYGTS